MDSQFFERPILNSPYDYPSRHWELDAHGQPTQRIVESRRRAEFITPIPKPRKVKAKSGQQQIVFDEGKGLSTEKQQYDPTPIINELRYHVDQWRNLKSPNDWLVEPETQRLLQHWRHHKFSGVRPFFCQIEAVETAIWLTEVAPKLGKTGKRFLEHLANANHDANPELMRLALKLATGAGKTTVMAMIVAWQTVNAVRRPGSPKFSRGFLVVTPGLTIRDRLQVLLSEPSGQLLRQPGARAQRHDGRYRPRQNRHHQLSRLQASRAYRALKRRPLAPPGPRRAAEHARNRRPDAPARHARPDGPQEHPRPQR